MKRNLYLTVVLVLVIALVSLSAASAQDEEVALFRVEVRNRTDGPVSILLAGTEAPSAYVLSAGPGQNRVFTVNAGSYDQTTFACGESATGTLAVTHQLRLVFTSCFSDAPNSGAPAIEKVHLTDAPDGKKWLYQYDPTPQPEAASPPGGGTAGACQFQIEEEITIYNRPSTAAGVFATVGPSFSAEITSRLSARTADGWLGFDPGIAQAANIGPFRLRWIAPGDGTLTGECSFPVVWGPPPGICFDMPMEDTNVYMNPDTSSPVAAVLHVREFAAILGHTPGGDFS
jgi:hypothetical protein